jgi:dCTP deaminase
MILTGPEIMRQREKGNIVIDPFDVKQLNPNSYNLRLGRLIKSIKPRTESEFDIVRAFDSRNPIGTTEIIEFNLLDDAILYPGQLWLGATMERTETNGIVPAIEGRSSWARLGLFVHITAGFGGDGFCGHWTLEMSSLFPIKLYAGMEICQIYYHAIQGERMPYKGRYQGQVQPRESQGV